MGNRHGLRYERPGEGNSVYPFFTTTGDKGTGMGLLISRKIVQENGGLISVASREGEGIRFQIRLPLTKIHS